MLALELLSLTFRPQECGAHAGEIVAVGGEDLNQPANPGPGFREARVQVVDGAGAPAGGDERIGPTT